jgi:tRNA threonylcarbamoyladenosine biosynthesis protein TsaE
MIRTTKSEQDTKKLAREIASELKGGEILALSGDLGAGKTTFVKGLAEYFNMADEVSSPTFTLIQEYGIDSSKYPLFSLVHIDCYRLNNEQELLDIGIQDYFSDPDSVVVIEWAKKVKMIIPKKAIWVEFRHGENINERIITKS